MLAGRGGFGGGGEAGKCDHGSKARAGTPRPPAQPRAYKGPNHRASIRTLSPGAWRVARDRRGAGVGKNRVASGVRAAPGEPIDGPRGRAKFVA